MAEKYETLPLCLIGFCFTVIVITALPREAEKCTLIYMNDTVLVN